MIRVGLSIESDYKDETRAPVQWMLERTAAARSAALDSLFVGDQHATKSPHYQNIPLLGRLLGEWGTNTVGSLHLLPLWHPVLLAEQIATLATLADGPFVLVCTLGAGGQQFQAMGVTLASRRSRFEESLNLIRGLLAGEEVSNEFFSVEGAVICPASPNVDIWIGGTADPALRRAARLGDGWIVGPRPSVEDARVLIERYLGHCETAGRLPRAIAIRRDIHVVSDAFEAESIMAAAPAGPVPPSSLVVGTVEQVEEQFMILADIGFTDVLVRHFEVEQRSVLDSLARLGDVRSRLVK